MDERYLKRLNRETGEAEPARYLGADPGSKLRRIPGTRLYFKWIDFELWRGLRRRLKREK